MKKYVQCGGCGKKKQVTFHGKSGYMVCECGTEYRIEYDPNYGLKQTLANDAVANAGVCLC